MELRSWFICVFAGICAILLPWPEMVTAFVSADRTPWGRIFTLAELVVIIILVVNMRERKKEMRSKELALREERALLEKVQAQEIEYLSCRDQLTDLHNRRFLEKTLAELDIPQNLPFSVIMADLDGLKLVNDTLGHAAGDELLQKAAQVMKSSSREWDLVGRWGGDEFVFLLPQTSSTEAEMIVSKLRQSLPMKRVHSLLVSWSFGWATKTEPGQSITNAFNRAEDQMYRYKLFQGPSIRSETIDALMATLFEKNQREEQHSQRVSELCQFIARKLGLNDWEIKELRLIGLFHDIGKIAIDESILNKPGTLNDEEWKQIRRHPEVGYRLLSAVQDMRDIASYVLAHHERWDGQGYPKGLKGEEIPLQSRIVSIADAYDAMISYRPYRRSLSKLEALWELHRNAGNQFDPKLVQVFLDGMWTKKWCL